MSKLLTKIANVAGLLLAALPLLPIVALGSTANAAVWF